MDVAITCPCPAKGTGEVRHPDGDTVTLRDRLDFRSVTTLRNTIVLLKQDDPDVSVAEILATLTEAYLLLGIESWTLVDEKHKAIEPTKATIRTRLLSHPDQAMTVGDAADELYNAAVILPLVARGQTSSPPTPTNGSTSPRTDSPARHPKRSKPSSTTTIPMDVIEMTSASLVGVSSSSLNSKSAV